MNSGLGKICSHGDFKYPYACFACQMWLEEFFSQACKDAETKETFWHDKFQEASNRADAAMAERDEQREINKNVERLNRLAVDENNALKAERDRYRDFIQTLNAHSGEWDEDEIDRRCVETLAGKEGG